LELSRRRDLVLGDTRFFVLQRLDGLITAPRRISALVGRWWKFAQTRGSFRRVRERPILSSCDKPGGYRFLSSTKISRTSYPTHDHLKSRSKYDQYWLFVQVIALRNLYGTRAVQHFSRFIRRTSLVVSGAHHCNSLGRLVSCISSQTSLETPIHSRRVALSMAR
jgi:hypothetical protein